MMVGRGLPSDDDKVHDSNFFHIEFTIYLTQREIPVNARYFKSVNRDILIIINLLPLALDELHNSCPAPLHQSLLHG